MWTNFIQFLPECWSQDEIPLQEGPAAVRRAERRGDRGQHHHPAGIEPEIWQGSGRRSHVRAAKCLPRYDIDDREPPCLGCRMLAHEEPGSGAEGLQGQSAACSRITYSERYFELLLQAHVWTQGNFRLSFALWFRCDLAYNLDVTHNFRSFNSNDFICIHNMFSYNLFAYFHNYIPHYCHRYAN